MHATVSIIHQAADLCGFECCILKAPGDAGTGETVYATARNWDSSFFLRAHKQLQLKALSYAWRREARKNVLLSGNTGQQCLLEAPSEWEAVEWR